MAALSSGLAAQQERPLPGRQPGTERWIVWLRDRGYDLNAHLQNVRAAPTRQLREQALAQLRLSVAADQAAIVQSVQLGGGTIEQQFWVLSAMAVELPTALVPVLERIPRVLRMAPVRSRTDASILPTNGAALGLPLSHAVDAFNHNVQGARNIIIAARGTDPSIPIGAEFGAGVRIAVLDTGIDQDAGGVNGTSGPHDGFLDGGIPPLDRVDAHIRAGISPAAGPTPHVLILPNTAIDCNAISFSGSTSGILQQAVAFRPCWHSTSAFHGTGMAFVAAGRQHGGHPDGHAPASRLIDISVSEVPDDPLTDRSRWTTSDATMLNAIQLLWGWMETTANAVHIINLSFDGWSDPLDPVAIALDEFAWKEDILIVTAAGNESDSTRFSNGFYNGLAVGAVHARLDTDPEDQYFAIAQTARGPLHSDLNRFYPDVCATGAGPGDGGTPRFRYGSSADSSALPSFLILPRIDSRDPCSVNGTGLFLPGSPCSSSTIAGCTQPSTAAAGAVPFGMPLGGGQYASLGTSPAAAQVSGAAALYRSTRPQASAMETRAAILLNTRSAMDGPNGELQDSYRNRNTFGVGYVRDDYLAEFAVRDATIAPLVATKSLTVALPEATQPLPALIAGDRYAAVCCWPRRYDTDGQQKQIADIDMEVREVGNPSHVLARSESRGNTYERLSFVATTPPVAAELRVVMRVAPPGMVVPMPVTLAFRRVTHSQQATWEQIHGSTGTVDSVPAASSPGGCTTTARSLQVVRRVPLAYANAWGSGPLAVQLLTGPPPDKFGMPLFAGFNLGGHTGSLPQGMSLHFEIRPDQVGPGPVTIGGIAFRAWRPFRNLMQGASIVVQEVRMGTSANAPVTSASLGSIAFSNTNLLSAQLNLPPLRVDSNGIVDHVAASFDEFPIVIPFAHDFAYDGISNLHIGLRVFGSPYEVDFARDGNASDSYGLAEGLGGSPSISIGTVPIFALLSSKAPMPDLRPELQCFGQPTIGRGLQFQVSKLPAQAGCALVIGTFSPFSSQIGTCDGHVLPGPGLVWSGVADFAGLARWSDVSIPPTPALVGSIAGCQVVALSHNLLSNALRLTIGGDL